MTIWHWTYGPSLVVQGFSASVDSPPTSKCSVFFELSPCSCLCFLHFVASRRDFAGFRRPCPKATAFELELTYVCLSDAGLCLLCLCALLCALLFSLRVRRGLASCVVRGLARRMADFW